MDNDLKKLEAGTCDGALQQRHNTSQNNTASRGQQPAWDFVWYPGKSDEAATKAYTEHRSNQAVYRKVHLIIIVPIFTFEIFVVVTAVTLVKTGRQTEANALLLLFIVVSGAWTYFIGRGLYSRMSNRGRIEIRRGLYNIAADLVVFEWVCFFVTFAYCSQYGLSCIRYTDALNSTTTGG